MKLRLTAFVVHLLASLAALTVIIGSLYLGWYRWPGWYLADAAKVTAVLAGVDLVVGPLLTLVIAAPGKPRHVLLRDVGVIAAVQLVALAYGAVSLWNGRPMYYAFSEDVLQVVQAYDIDPPELKLAQEQNAPLVPHWYNLPRWIWAPLPADAAERDKIMGAAISGGADVIGMPRYYRTWESGLPTLRKQLKKVDDIKYFSGKEKKLLKVRMQAAGIPSDESNAMALTGRALPLLVVIDPGTLRVRAIFAAH